MSPQLGLMRSSFTSQSQSQDQAHPITQRRHDCLLSSLGQLRQSTHICISWTLGPQAHVWNMMSRVPNSGKSQVILFRSISCGNRKYAERNSWEIYTIVYNQVFQCAVTVSGPVSTTSPTASASMTLKVNYSPKLSQGPGPHSTLDTGASVSFWHGVVSKSLLIFALNPLLFLILSLHLHTRQPYLCSELPFLCLP